MSRFPAAGIVDIHLSLDTDTVTQAFPAQPLLVEHDTSVSHVLRLMRDKNEGGVLVRRHGKLAGIFTERDALGLMANDADMEVPIEEVMTRDLATLSPEDSVAEAISKMSAGGYRHLPIVDDAGHPVGMLRAAGILHYLVEHFPRVVHTLPPEPHHGMQEREGA